MNDRVRGQASENGPESPADKELTAPENGATGRGSTKVGSSQGYATREIFALEFGWQGTLPPRSSLQNLQRYFQV